MNLVQREYEGNNLDRVRELLEAQVPKEAGVTDWRNFEWYYWQRMIHRELLILKGPSDQGRRVRLTDVTFSPDGRLLAAASQDGTVRVWDAATGKEQHILKGNTSTLTGMAFSPDSRRLAWAGKWTAKLWDTVTGKELFLLSVKAPTSEVTCVAFSPDSRRLATAVYDGHIPSRDRPHFVVAEATVRLWDAVTGKELFTLKGHTSMITCLVFSPDSRRLASSDSTVRVWDAENGKELFTLKRDRFRAKSVAFSPDGLRLAAADGYDARVRIWDAVAGKELFTTQENGPGLQRVSFSPDGRRLVLVSNQVRVLDAANGKELFTLKAEDMFALRHTGRIALSPDGRRLVSADGHGDPSVRRRVRLWDAVTGKELFTLKAQTSEVQSLAFSPDGQRLAFCGEDGKVRVYNVVGDQERLILNGHTRMEKVVVFKDGRPRHEDRARGVTVRAVAFSPDGRRLASAGYDRVVRVWDAETGKELPALKGHTPKTQGFGIDCVSFSPDGRQLVSAGDDLTVRLWDAASGENLRTLLGNTIGICGVSFSPDGQRVISVSRDQAVRTWDAATGKELLTLKGLMWVERLRNPANGKEVFLTTHLVRVASVAFSPDGQRLALGGAGQGDVRVWDAATGKELLTFKDHSHALTFSPDSRRLVSASSDSNVRIWDAATGKELLTFKGHRDGVQGVSFSPDGRRLATAGNDGTVRLWDAATGQELLILKGHTDRVYGVAFSPDGRRLASAGGDGTVRIWEASPVPDEVWRRPR